MRSLRFLPARRVTYPVWVWLALLFLLAYMTGCDAHDHAGHSSRAPVVVVGHR